VTAGGAGAAARIRVAASPADWAAVRSLCCRTGNAGEPIEPARWPLFGALWIGPYQRLVPEWTYVADADGHVVGYLTGCPDTAAFRRARRYRVTLPLLAAIACRRYPWNADARRAVRLALHLDRGLESRLAPAQPADLARTHPAHLHMNVEAEYRRHGIGAALIERYVEDLTAAGVAGVHLLCGPGPRPFYARNGFTDLAAVELGPGRWVYTLGRRLGREARPAGARATGGGA
jgi:GNAT superfamily N-acetyltransferase